METPAYVASMRLDGGHPALNFVNTLGGLHDREPRPGDEHLRRYADVIAFGLRIGLLPEHSAERLLRLARRRPREAKHVYRNAVELRSLVDAVFRPLAEGGSPSARVLLRLRDAEREALARASLEPAGHTYRWSWSKERGLEAPLWPLAHAAAELLTGGPLERLKLCAHCRWLFLDASRNRSRRWCSMEDCGTATKKRRYIERRRASRVSG